LVGVLGVFVWAYSLGIDTPYYADDFKFYFPALGMNWADHFVETGPTTGFYRPLQNAILTLIQQVAGSNPVPVHALTLAVHLGVVVLVYRGSRWIGASDTQAIFAAALMAVAQAGAAAVLGNDTLSQVGATLFGYLSLWGYGRVLASDGHRVAAYTGALSALGMALLFKESAFAFVLLLVGLEAADGWRRASAEGTSDSSIGERAARLAPVLGVAALYLAIRSSAGAMSPGLGDGPYQFAIGPNVARNLILFGAAATSVVPTTAVALWAQTGQWVHLLAGLMGSAGIVILVAAGVYRSGREKTVLALLAVAATSLVTVVPLNDVSELYVYTALPPLCAIAGIGLGAVWRKSQGRRRVALGLLLSAVFLMQAVGVRQKAMLMKKTADRTQTVLQQVVEIAKATRPGTTLCLRNAHAGSATDTTAYSVYRMPGVTPLTFAEPVVQYQARRPDLQFMVGTPHCPPSDTTVILHLRRDGRSVKPEPASIPPTVRPN
jgi:hypothetical protein